MYRLTTPRRHENTFPLFAIDTIRDANFIGIENHFG
jgi:hypothetical protein